MISLVIEMMRQDARCVGTHWRVPTLGCPAWHSHMNIFAQNNPSKSSPLESFSDISKHDADQNAIYKVR